MLSGFSEPELDAFLGESALRPYTHTTIVRPKLMRDQIARIQLSGVASSCEEWSIGTSGVAAPVYIDGSVVAAIGVVGASNERLMQSHGQYVKLAAARLSRALAPNLHLVAA